MPPGPPGEIYKSPGEIEPRIPIKSLPFMDRFSWAPNIGWINFDANGDISSTYGALLRPRIQKATGILEGYAWAPNAGWLPLNSDPVSQVDVNGAFYGGTDGLMLR